MSEEELKTKYFNSRTAARRFVSENTGYRFKDQGADKPKGERWSAIPELGQQIEKTRETAAAGAKAVEKAYRNKKQHAIALVTSMREQGHPRKDIIERMCNEIGISSNCASTYYQNVKLGRWVAA